MGTLLIGQEIIHNDHKALQFIQFQKCIDPMHIRWIGTIKKFSYVFKLKFGVLNKVVDALKRKVTLLTTLQNQGSCFDSVKKDLDFGKIWQKLME